MKYSPIFRRASVILVVLLMLAMTVAPVAAQEPGDEGDVGAAWSTYTSITFNPYGVQEVPAGGTSTTEIMVTDIEDLYSVNIAFDYDSYYVEVLTVQPGTMFSGMTQGVDYLMTTTLNRTAPLSAGEPALSVPGTVPYAGMRTYVNIVITNYNHPRLPLAGNGSLVKIQWKARNVGGPFPVFGNNLMFPTALNVLGDEFGNPIVGGGFPNTTFNIVAAPPATTLQFQVALQGAVYDPLVAPPAIGNMKYMRSTIVPADTNNDLKPMANNILGLIVPAIGWDFGTGSTVQVPCTTSCQVTVSKRGYLSATGSNLNPSSIVDQVTLVAGDVDNNGTVNVFDLQQVASYMGQGVNNWAYLETMDYNGDSVIGIQDLALVANNYGRSGPTQIKFH
jgi:hypothetical protein